MSIPLIALGAGAAALLFAGSKEKKPSATAGGSATPTTQSTGGDEGQPTAPSHAGSETYNGGTETATADGGGTYADLPPLTGGPLVPTKSDLGSLSYTDAGSVGVETGQESAFTGDPWQQTTSTSLDTSKVNSGSTALGAVTRIGEVTAKAAADSFTYLGTLAGSVW